MGSSAVRRAGKNLELWNWRKKNGQKFCFSSTSDGLTVFISRFTVDCRPANTTKKKKKKKRERRRRENFASGWTEVRKENVSD